jgi:hypothetical protein
MVRFGLKLGSGSRLMFSHRRRKWGTIPGILSSCATSHKTETVLPLLAC